MTTKTTATRHASIEIRLDIDDLDETHAVPNHIKTVMFVPDVVIFYATGPDPDTMTSVRANLIGPNPDVAVRQAERIEWHFNDRHFPNDARDPLLPRWVHDLLVEHGLSHLVPGRFVDPRQPVDEVERLACIDSLPVPAELSRSVLGVTEHDLRQAQAVAWDVAFPDMAGPFSAPGMVTMQAFSQWRVVALTAGTLTILMAAEGHGPQSAYQFVHAGIMHSEASHRDRVHPTVWSGQAGDFDALIESIRRVPHTHQA